MSDFQDSMDYFSNKAKSAVNRGSTVNLEEQLDHVETLLQRYAKESTADSFSETPKDTSLVGEFSNFYKEIYQSSTDSPTRECVDLVHGAVWSGIYIARNTNHRKIYDSLLSIAIDQYLDENYTDSPSETVVDRTESNLRTLLQSVSMNLEDATNLREIQSVAVQFNSLFSQARRIIRESPKRGVLSPVKGILQMVSNLNVMPFRILIELVDYSNEIRVALNHDDSDNEQVDKLKGKMSIEARKHRLALLMEEEIENLQFVGSAWVTHLRLEDVISVEDYQEFEDDIISNRYSTPTEIAEQFFQLVSDAERYWEMWELNRRMEQSQEEVVSSGSATWNWLLEFYCIQMVRVLVQSRKIETDYAEENPIPMEEILRVRTDRILEKLSELREREAFSNVLSGEYDEQDIEAAVGRLREAHEQRKSDAQSQWVETIRNADLETDRENQLKSDLREEILSKFRLREVFNSCGWLKTEESAPDEVSFETHLLERASFQKQSFVTDPYVSQILNTSQLTAHISTKATETWVETFEAQNITLAEGEKLSSVIENQNRHQEPVCYLVDIGDEKQRVSDLDSFSYRLDQESNIQITDTSITGYLDGVPVISTWLGDIKAIIVGDDKKTVYEENSVSPFSIEVLSGEEWADRHPDEVPEEADPRLKVVVEVKYTFGVEGGELTVVR